MDSSTVFLLSPTLVQETNYTWGVRNSELVGPRACKLLEERLTRSKGWSNSSQASSLRKELNEKEIGNRFEKRLYECSQGSKPNPYGDRTKSHKRFEDIGELVKDCSYQKKVNKIKVYGSWHFMLYGRMDFSNEQIIYDVKTTSRKFGPDHLLLNYAQHVFYRYITGIKYFEYLICKLDKNYRIIDYNKVRYHKGFDVVEKDLYYKIRQFHNQLIDLGLWETYKEYNRYDSRGNSLEHN